MIEMEVDVSGSFSKQHPLVKAGTAAVLILLVLFGNYVPLALTIWLIFAGSDDPTQLQPTLWAWLFVAVLLFGMFAVGCYCIAQFFDWIANGRFSKGWIGGILNVISFVSVAIASLALTLEHWETTLLGAFLGIAFSGLAAGVLTGLGRAMENRGRKH